MCKIPHSTQPGHYPLEPLPTGWVNKLITFKSSNGEISRKEIVKLDTQDRYIQEPLGIIALKCAILFFLGNPIYFAFYTAVQLTRIVFVPIANISVNALFKEVWHAVKIPFFFIAMEFASLYGIFCPLEGRDFFQKIESLLHEGKTRREAFGYRKDERRLLEILRETFMEEKPKDAFFAGICMQKLGKLDDSYIIRSEDCLENSQAS